MAAIVHTDLSNDEYHANKTHLSRSHVHRFKGRYGWKTQKFCDAGRSVFDGSASTDLGSSLDAAFSAVVEKRSLDDVFCVPPVDVLTSNGQRRGKAFDQWKENLPPGAIEVSPATRTKIDDMIASILEHDEARRLIEETTSTQTSVFWTDPDGFNRKARADGVTPSLWYDLKTTSAEWRDLHKSFIRFGYHWQASWYHDAAVAAGHPEFTMPFIVVQTDPPHAVKVVTLPSRLIEFAGREIRETLFEMRRRRDTGVYVPEDYGKVEELEFPEYVYSG